ncbi:translation initiation factor IF-1 [Patescibacteria group bacterium]|jgi:translation initiation factor IF-1|nr:translation initiation factor IF-1 [Patescibacteria group bacterium]MCL5114836.1 translation initiation factor IF-1 [Patescibacteria group bacterium]
MKTGEKLLQVHGIVVEALPGLLFRVKSQSSNGEKEILAHLAGRLKLNRIKVIPGDKVIMEMTNENDTRGRIVRRL